MIYELSFFYLKIIPISCPRPFWSHRDSALNRTVWAWSRKKMRNKLYEVGSESYCHERWIALKNLVGRSCIIQRTVLIWPHLEKTSWRQSILTRFWGHGSNTGINPGKEHTVLARCPTRRPSMWKSGFSVHYIPECVISCFMYDLRQIGLWK
jgi:hypothetical protein